MLWFLSEHRTSTSVFQLWPDKYRSLHFIIPANINEKMLTNSTTARLITTFTLQQKRTKQKPFIPTNKSIDGSKCPCDQPPTSMLLI